MAESYPMVSEGRRRRRRRLAVAAIALLSLVGLLVVADRVAVAYAEDRVAREIRAQVAERGLRSGPVQVTIDRFPFLTQVIAGHYPLIRVVVPDVQGDVAGHTVRLPRLDVELRDVTASLRALRGEEEASARWVTGRVIVAYDTVEEIIDRPGLTLTERNGQLRVTAPLVVVGREYTVEGTAQVVVESDQVRLRVTELTSADLPTNPAIRALVRAYAEQISIRVPLPDLPFDLDVDEVSATPDGLAVIARASDVPVTP